jgi:hypothetical protein
MRHPGAVRGSQPPLRFELRSADARVLGRAAIVFKPWADASNARPSGAWRVDRTPGDVPGWRITAEQTGDAILRDSVADAVRVVEFLAVQALFECAAVCAVHAALVARDGRGVLLVGTGQTGKSTLACALWQRGWALLGDDMAVVDVPGRLAWPAPRRVSLREGSRALVDGALWPRLLATPAAEATSEGCLFDPADLDGGERRAPVSLAGIVFLGRHASDPTSGATVLEPAHALLALLPYTSLARRMDMGAALRRLGPLADAVPACDLARGSLAAMTEAVEAFLDDHETTRAARAAHDRA